METSPPRLSFKKVTPPVSAAMGALHHAAVAAGAEAGVEPELLEIYQRRLRPGISIEGRLRRHRPRQVIVHTCQMVTTLIVIPTPISRLS